MTYKIYFTETTKEEYQNLEPEPQKACAKLIKSFAKKPFQGLELQSEMGAYRSVNFRQYRMVFLLENQKVIICGITRRANIYAHLGRNIMQMV